MKKILSKLYGIKATEIKSFFRKDSGNDNSLYEIISENKKYFLKEIPDHSQRDDLNSIYQELSKCNPQKFKMVLPLLSIENNYLVNIDEKKMMLYPFVDHQVLNEVDIDLDTIFDVLTELIDVLNNTSIPEHPFKTYQSWFERGVTQIKNMGIDHPFLDKFEDFTENRFKEIDFQKGHCHFDLNPFNVWIGREGNIFLSDFDNAQVSAIAKDIFDICSKFLRSTSSEVSIMEDQIEKIFKFSSQYIKGISKHDVKYLLVRPKLGELFDPNSKLTNEDISKRLDLYLEHIVL